MTLYSQAESNTKKTWMLLGGFFLLLVGAGWAISVLLGSQLFLLLALALSIGGSFASYWYSDRIVVRLTGAKEADRAEYAEVCRLVENLSIASGLPAPRLFIIDSSQPNAFATGRSAEKGVVAVTTGLLERLDRSELEGVLAHELSHIGNKDMLVSSIAVVLVGTVVLLADFFFRTALWGGSRNSREGGQARLLLIGVALVFLVLAPLLANLLKFAISRKREYLADASGALLTRYPEGLVRALEKIAQDPHELKGASDGTAHLFFANPFRGKEQERWIHRMFSTHPPVQDRVRALRMIEL
ncbi:MAG: M48 family metallopeptidase [bacterium]|nr:M48 family metallopeptidase [bacterium]